jgi:hypothetical protein
VDDAQNLFSGVVILSWFYNDRARTVSWAHPMNWAVTQGIWQGTSFPLESITDEAIGAWPLHGKPDGVHGSYQPSETEDPLLGPQ